MVIGDYLFYLGGPYRQYIQRKGQVYRKLFLFVWRNISGPNTRNKRSRRLP